MCRFRFDRFLFPSPGLETSPAAEPKRKSIAKFKITNSCKDRRLNQLATGSKPTLEVLGLHSFFEYAYSSTCLTLLASETWFPGWAAYDAAQAYQPLGANSFIDSWCAGPCWAKVGAWLGCCFEPVFKEKKKITLLKSTYIHSVTDDGDYGGKSAWTEFFGDFYWPKLLLVVPDVKRTVN